MSLIAVKSTPDYAAALFLEDEYFLGGCSVNRCRLLAFPQSEKAGFDFLLKASRSLAFLFPCQFFGAISKYDKK